MRNKHVKAKYQDNVRKHYCWKQRNGGKRNINRKQTYTNWKPKLFLRLW